MTAEQIVRELEELAENSGITVRYEKGDFDGGFCVLKSERLIVVNRKLAAQRKASVLAQGVAEVGIDELYLKPAVREYIEDELARLSGSKSATAVLDQVEPEVAEPTESAPADLPGSDVESPTA